MILICRHGQTKWNLENRKQGWLDSELTELGKSQAKALQFGLKTFCREKKFKVICSPLGRVKSTAKIALAKAIYVSEITYDERLREHSFGAWEGFNSEEIEVRFPGMLEKREKDCWNFQLPKGESYALLENRLTSFLDDIDKSQDILLFCHEMVSKTLRKILLNLSQQQALSLTHDQFSFFVIDNMKMHQYHCNPNYHS
jgi:probable phosphoglycerate mutase